VVAVPADRVGEVAHAPDGRTGGPLRGGTDAVLDRALHGVGELVATGREQLDAVVRHRVVRRGDHHAEVGTEVADQERHRGRGQDPDAHRVGTGRGEPGDDRGLEHLAARSRITADDGDRAARAVALGEHPGGRGGKRHGELRGEELAVGQSADAVGAEQTPCAQSVSACCTEVPCGPS
jgi:hypothetical protein